MLSICSDYGNGGGGLAGGLAGWKRDQLVKGGSLGWIAEDDCDVLWRFAGLDAFCNGMEERMDEAVDRTNRSGHCRTGGNRRNSEKNELIKGIGSSWMGIALVLVIICFVEI